MDKLNERNPIRGGVNYDDSNICGIDTIRNNNSNKWNYKK